MFYHATLKQYLWKRYTSSACWRQRLLELGKQRPLVVSVLTNNWKSLPSRNTYPQLNQGRSHIPQNTTEVRMYSRRLRVKEAGGEFSLSHSEQLNRCYRTVMVLYGMNIKCCLIRLKRQIFYSFSNAFSV